MIQTHIRLAGLFILLLALQVMVLNHVHICGYATPLIGVYFVLVLPQDMPHWSKLLWGFALGLIQDMFANTPGMMSATLTLMAFLQPWLLNMFGGIDSENDDDIVPSIAQLGALPFIRYALTGTLLQCTVFYLLEIFSFFSFTDTLINILGSTVLSLLIILAIESLRSRHLKN
ncbi:MAG: rod shape-determining protein MreD [Bacteroidaceae bacterium]|nr:rod shape-determining protein MreD [Bacteroidaceae bacterium]MBO4593947.1 rod shape-determining protein MreD [Bacteroidaceae bacterium]MBR4783609.1 rod shape-determining protein MreD [Bacteroidaceae bacterium]